jgi:hypothetical protein
MFRWKVVLRGLTRLPVTVNVVSLSLILSTLMMVAKTISERMVLTGFTQRHIPDIIILHSHRSKNLKSYTYMTSLRFAKLGTGVQTYKGTINV